MSVNLPAHFSTQFTSNVQLLLQQKQSRLRQAVDVGSYVGKSGEVVQQYGAIEMQQVTSRFAQMGRVDAAVDSRWVFPTSYDLPQMIDSFDKLKLLTDPSSKFVENGVAAANRKFDSVIIAAINGTAKTGEAGGTSTVLPSGRKIAHGGAGLTMAKLKQAKKMLMAANVDLDNDPIYCAITAEQHEDLMNETQAISGDYQNVKLLADGRLDRLYGINFIHTELLASDGTSRLVPMFAKSGVHLGIWNDIETSISQRNDIQGLPWQAYIKLSIGATRTEENKIVQIACNE